MKRLLLLTTIFTLLFASSAFAMITMSRHNLGSTHPAGAQYGDVYTAAGTTEVCVFCHTPHGGTTDAPLWNRAMATAGAYTPYSSSTIDTSVGQPDGVSLACLSCHDGTIALDALRNAPGSGGFSTTPTSQGWTFSGISTSPGNNTLPEDGRITNLTQVLSDDHPISMVYPTATQDPKFFTPATCGNAQCFDENSNSRADDNEVRLFTSTTGYKVQCASCHNPHGTTASIGTPASNLAPNGVDYAVFLRKSQSASGLCVTCHIK
ncbi:MAG: hypothetical protein HZC10_05460 [Nitrospirae bacterium]|nr:hypothetical protein [Nitrospirota bacterium]